MKYGLSASLQFLSESLDSLPFRGNRRSKKYHRIDCPSYDLISTKNQVPYGQKNPLTFLSFIIPSWWSNFLTQRHFGGYCAMCWSFTTTNSLIVKDSWLFQSSLNPVGDAKIKAAEGCASAAFVFYGRLEGG